MEMKAYNKGMDIIKSCKTLPQLRTAYNWVWLYKKKYGETNLWESLLSYCSKRRNCL